MTETKKYEGNVTKNVLVGAAVLAGVVAAIALKNKKTRKMIEKSMKDMREKGMQLKKKAENWVEDHPIQDDINDMRDEISEKFSRKNPVKKVARAAAAQ